jgi:hypothetical protein
MGKSERQILQADGFGSDDIHKGGSSEDDAGECI